jgi:hypothetical protein
MGFRSIVLLIVPFGAQNLRTFPESEISEAFSREFRCSSVCWLNDIMSGPNLKDQGLVDVTGSPLL